MTDQNHSYDPPIEQYLSASAHFGTELDTEAETYYYLLSAIERLRPSIIFGLAKISKDQRQFCSLIQKAVLATVCIDRAEYIAGDACEGFPPDKPHSADAAWLLILLAAGQKAEPDTEWIEARAMCKRVYECVNAGPSNLLERLLGDAGTQPVCFDALPDGRADE